MRMPGAALLSQTVTVYNRVTPDKPVNGGYPERYERTIIGNVRYVQREGAVTVSSHGAVSDSLYLMIFPGISDTGGKTYAEPAAFVNALDRSKLWTMQKGIDYIALGAQTDEKPSYENNGGRNDYKISTVDIRYNPDGSIHHFEVNAK